MTNFREIAKTLGPVRDVPKNTAGSQEHVVLRRLGHEAPVVAAKAALALARCGISLLEAKRAVEAVLDEGEETLILPMVSTRPDLSQDLATAGINVVFRSAVGSCQH